MYGYIVFIHVLLVLMQWFASLTFESVQSAIQNATFVPAPQLNEVDSCSVRVRGESLVAAQLLARTRDAESCPFNSGGTSDRPEFYCCQSLSLAEWTTLLVNGVKIQICVL